MKKLVSVLILIFLSTACIKTAEQVQREKRMESISQQMGDTQGLMADLVSQMKDMQSQLDRMNGRLEELEHKQKQVDPQGIAKMNESVNLMKTQSDTQGTQLVQIQNEIREQRIFLEKVTESLAAHKDQKEKSVDRSEKKKSARGELEKALKLVKENKYDEARDELEALIDHEDLTPGDQNKVFHGLGRVEYFSGQPDKALVYFSKIYTKYPKATLAPSSLLFIGRSLFKMGKKDEAKEAFSKVLEDYKGSKEANEAKKEL